MKIFFLILTTLLMISCSRNSPNVISIDKEPVIRVLLTNPTAKKSFNLKIEEAFILEIDKKKLKNNTGINFPIKIVDSGVYWSEKLFKGQQFKIIPDKGRIGLDNNFYYGQIHIQKISKSGWAVLNIIGMEQYLVGVIGEEMPLNWGISALEAQAIIARTYALYEIIHNKGTRKYFDVYDNHNSQVYSGAKLETEKSISVVKNTRGMVMLDENNIFKSFFHSTCGGHTSSAKKVFKYEDINALSGVQCPYCKGSKYYEWEHKALIADFYKMCIDLKLISSSDSTESFRKNFAIEIIEKDKAGRAIKIKIFTSEKKSHIILSTDFRLTLGASKLRSSLFEMHPIENGILFKGRGWGHGVGLCQVGAGKMAEKGFSAKKIIEYYYPCVNLIKLWK